MNNSSIVFTSIEPIYDLAIPITHLNLDKYFYKNDADNISAINTYMNRCDLDIYAVNKTANNIFMGVKNSSSIELITTGYYIQLKGILYGSGIVRDYPGPDFSYIRKIRLNEYLVSFDVKNKFKSKDLMADLSIKVTSPFWMKNSNIIELKFINTTFLDNIDENDEIDDDYDEYHDDWWKK